MAVDVFLVEDQQQMKSVLHELLQSVGDFHVVGHATTEAEALNWLDNHRGEWELAIIDLVLEQGSGISVIARARLRAPRGKVAVLSSFVSPGIRKHCLKLGADAAFQKDADLDEFMRFCSAIRPEPAEQRNA
ncbi:MAG: response regulator transcription factor [Burkholderiales bacterium]|nr:response regulator transcription factor [Burkholderiales bacterium]